MAACRGAGTLATLLAHRAELFDPTIAKFGGRIVKLMGDGALVEFPSVVDAVECAVAIQKGMAERNAETPEDHRIVFRIGINLGDVIIERDDYSARRYAEAIDAFKKIVSPRYMHLAEAAACHARIDDQDSATELATAALRLNPGFTVDQYMKTRTYQDPADAEHLAEGLRAAGLPG